MKTRAQAQAPSAGMSMPADRRKRIGILGGTFDPVHNGHLILADRIRRHMELDVVIFIPSKAPPHKIGEAVAAGTHRLAMTRLATAGDAYFVASDVEIQAKDGLSYTYDTLSRLTERYGGDTDFYFIMGADSAFTIESWYRADEMLSRFYFVVGNRPDFAKPELAGQIKALNQKYGNHIKAVAIPDTDISSTQIRQMVKDGLSVSHLTPQAVERYIVEHGLYQ